jgi:hypothetical protein
MEPLMARGGSCSGLFFFLKQAALVCEVGERKAVFGRAPAPASPVAPAGALPNEYFCTGSGVKQAKEPGRGSQRIGGARKRRLPAAPRFNVCDCP